VSADDCDRTLGCTYAVDHKCPCLVADIGCAACGTEWSACEWCGTLGECWPCAYDRGDSEPEPCCDRKAEQMAIEADRMVEQTKARLLGYAAEMWRCIEAMDEERAIVSEAST